jgi:PIN domain nuclease of toxin-antitoxin system
MNILLDTCTFLWIAAGSSELSDRAREVFATPDNDVFLSSVSAWEIAVKTALGKLPLPSPPDRFVPEVREMHGIEPLPLAEAACLLTAKLPPLHRDPFDRMLVCQAMAEAMAVLTPDPDIARYPVRTIW